MNKTLRNSLAAILLLTLIEISSSRFGHRRGHYRSWIRDVLKVPRLSRRLHSSIKARPDEFPHHASIFSHDRFGQNLDHLCAGVLITERHVLTVARCAQIIEDHVNPYILVALGIHTLEEDLRGKIYYVETVSSGTGPKDYENDIGFEEGVAILKLSTPVRFSELVTPVRLPRHNQRILRNLDDLKNSGFGLTSRDSRTPRTTPLMKIKLKFMLNDLCAETISNHQESLRRRIRTFIERVVPEIAVPAINSGVPMRRVGPHHLCAVRSRSFWATNGELGSGIVNADNVLVGLVDDAIASGNDMPNIFTNVQYYLNFIHEEIRK